MGTACHRTNERVMAALGQLNGATTLFEDNNDVKFGGVLFGLPALLSNGLLCFKQKDFKIPENFYTNTHIFLFLAYMALSRKKILNNFVIYQLENLGKYLV